MGFYNNLGADHICCRNIAELANVLPVGHRFLSDLDLYCSSIEALSNNEHWEVVNQAIFNDSWVIRFGDSSEQPIIQFKIRLFNELIGKSTSLAANGIKKQYADEISLFLKECKEEMQNGKICGYFAAVVTEWGGNCESNSFYPKEGSFEYYLNIDKGVAYKIIGEVL